MGSEKQTPQEALRAGVPDGAVGRGVWLSDFAFEPGRLRVKATGAIVPLNVAIAKEFFAWFAMYAGVQATRASRVVAPKHGPKVWFASPPPRPWYLLWPTLQMAGAQIVEDPAKADVLATFEDSTLSDPVERPQAAKPGASVMNLACTDVSKTKVGRVFEEVFGYPLALDPRTHRGPAVAKSEKNGAHDGHIVQCPAEPKPGFVYQRLIDNVDETGRACDIRCPTVRGEVPVVFMKCRPKAHRFENHNDRVRMVEPSSVLTQVERQALSEFAAAMDLDWGGMDVLRDARDGRIYVVDVNKTDMGPPTAMPWRDQMRAVRRLAEAFSNAYPIVDNDHVRDASPASDAKRVRGHDTMRTPA